MGITKEGIEGEQKLFKFLRDKNFKFFQPDAIGFLDNQWYVFEAKQQERFTPPPFEGHGLPLWQIKARLNFEKTFGIKAVLIIFDKQTNEIFCQFLSVLEKGKYIDTKGLKPRRVYKLSNFKNMSKVILKNINNPMEKLPQGNTRDIVAKKLGSQLFSEVKIEKENWNEKGEWIGSSPPSSPEDIKKYNLKYN